MQRIAHKRTGDYPKQKQESKVDSTPIVIKACNRVLFTKALLAKKGIPEGCDTIASHFLCFAVSSVLGVVTLLLSLAFMLP